MLAGCAPAQLGQASLPKQTIAHRMAPTPRSARESESAGFRTHVVRTASPGGKTPRPSPGLSLRIPRIAAPSATLEDLGTGRVLFAKQADVRRPIASLAKI